MKILVRLLLFISILLLPTQLGKHFWFTQSLVLGRRIDYLSPTLYLRDVVILMLAVLLFWQKRPKILLRVFFTVAACIIVFLFLWVLPSSASIPAFYGMYRFFLMILFAVSVVKSKPDPWQVLVPLGLATVVTVFLEIAQFLQQGSLGGVWYWLGERRFSDLTPQIAHLLVNGQLLVRPYATFPHPNVLAGFLVLTMPLFLSSPVQTRFQYLFRQLVIAAELIGIFLSFSRAVWFITFLFLLYHFLVHPQKLRFRQKSWWLVGGLLLVILEECTFGRFRNLLTVDAISISERLLLQQSAVMLFFKAPLLGVGLDNFIPAVATVSSPPYLLQPVHSIYLLLLSETGLVGFLCVCFLVMWVYKHRCGKFFPAALSSCLLAALLGVVDHYLLTIAQTQLLLALVTSLLLL